MSINPIQASPPGRSHSRLLTLSIQSVLLGLALGGSAHAADDDQDTSKSVTTLPEISVTAETAPETATSPVRGFVAKRSASATKTDTPILETPVSISVITRDEIDARGATSVTEAARYVPGVLSETYGNETRNFDWFTIRGFDGLVTSDYRDGLRQFGTNFTFPRTEAYGLERIEVVRGPGSVLFGQVDAGGIINRVTKRPDLDAPNELQLRFNNFDRKEIDADVGGALNKDKTLLYRLIAVGLDTGSQDEYLNGQDVRNEHQYFAPSLSWKPSGDTSFTLLADVLNNRTPRFSFTYTDIDSGFPKPTNRLVGDPDFNEYDQRQANIGYQFEHHFNSRWTVRQNFRATHDEINFRRVYDYANIPGFPSGNVVRTAAIFDDSVDSLTLDTHLQADFQTGGVVHKLLLGVDWLHGDSVVRHTEDGIGFDLATQTPTSDDFIFDVNNPVYGVPIATPTTPILGNLYNEELNQIGLYVQDQIKLTPRWALLLGERFDQSDIDHDDREVVNNDIKQDDSAFSGRAALTYLSPLGLAPYASYSESFLPQGGTDENGAIFKPTQGKQYEIGIKYQPPGVRALITLALFDLTKTNTLSFNPNARPDPDNPDILLGQTFQTGEINSQGIEIEGKATLIRGLNLSTALTFDDIRITKDAFTNDAGEHVLEGKQPLTTSEKLASAYLDYTIPAGNLRGLGVGFGARYIGPQFVDQLNTQHTAGYTLFDAGIHYDTTSWRLALNVANLTDRKYVANCAFGFCAPGIERTILGTATYRW